MTDQTIYPVMAQNILADLRKAQAAIDAALEADIATAHETAERRYSELSAILRRNLEPTGPLPPVPETWAEFERLNVADQGMLRIFEWNRIRKMELDYYNGIAPALDEGRPPT